MELGKIAYWIPRIVIVSIAIVSIIMIVGSITSYKLDIDEIKSYITRNKIILDEDCLAYKDYRTHLGVIDKDKFNKNNIQNCLNIKTGVILNLTYEEFSKSILINEDLADKRGLCFDEETFSCIRKEYNLILKDDLNEIPAKLIIDTINLK